MPGPDLHVHSTASDGTLSPARLVDAAASLSLPGLALTDHDTVEGVAPAIEAARHHGIEFVPGVELSAGVGERSVHILGYLIDHTDRVLRERLARLREIRLERAEAIVRALRADGFSISLDDVLRLSDGGAVGRAHIAQSLVEAGRVSSVDEAFKTLLGRSAPYYVPKPVSQAKTVIGWVGDAGGVAVLAHPGLSKADDLVPGLAADGIVGIEAYHGGHDASARIHYRRLASDLGLIATGGSDYHGDQHEGGALGSADVPPEALTQLVEIHRQRCMRA